VSLEWVQSYKQNPSKASFLDLPRELRDYIYSFAFQVSGAILVYSTNPYRARPDTKAMIVRHGNEGPIKPQKLGNAFPLSIIRTCKQLHAECSPVLYGQNVFRVWFLHTRDLSPKYRQLVRHLMFTTCADNRIYSPDLDEVDHVWKRRFWPTIRTAGVKLLEDFPNLETLTFDPHPPSRSGWRPAFFAVENKTKEQRIALAAQWLRTRCPIDNDRLRACLQLEFASTPGIPKEDFQGSRFAPDEDDDCWDHTEFAEAFRLMKESWVTSQSHTSVV